ncbi:MAG TPA: hypothetical protein VKB02_07005 [Pyrinomonadaceae bacterium]|nr:hypothetical protein [Pyrinomonadaceae bacterium]
MKPTAQLANVLIAKSILETILVGTIAVAVYMKMFPPTFHGWGEAVAASRSISGWVVDDADPWRRVEVQLFVDGKLVGTQVAGLSRPDVLAARWAKDEWHGYNFVLNALGEGMHEARVYALHKSGDQYTLQMSGDPITIEVREDGSWITRRARNIS